MSRDLSRNTAIITGGGTGIGKEIAITLAYEGVNIVVCGRRKEPLDRTVQRVLKRGGSAIAFQADISRESDIKNLIGMTLNSFGSIDILVNNAGISGGGFIHSHDVDTWDQVMSINLRAPFILARHIVPLMRKKNYGHIINISSESGLEYYKGNGAYGVAKHALNALGEFIQRENQEFGIRVDTICPGMVITEMTKNIPKLNHKKSLYPEDIAQLVIWLLTRRSNVKIGAPILIQTMDNPWV
jgi:NAD(P)-dependent dehydrogenase (short-subunit alcohol dehydrogenase family)